MTDENKPVHTPVPWTVVHGAQIYGPDEENVATANRMRNRENQTANAAFIVEACNQHAALREALDEAREIVTNFVAICKDNGINQQKYDSFGVRVNKFIADSKALARNAP